MSLQRMISIYFRLYGQQLKAALENKADFIIMATSALVSNVLGLIFLNVIFNRIPHIQGWSLNEISFLYGAIVFGEGVAYFLFEGMWRLNVIINNGELDRILLRPAPAILQIVSSKVGINGFGNLVLGLVIIILSLLDLSMNWTYLKIIMLVILLISVVLLIASLSFIANCISFWVKSGIAFPLAIKSVSEFSRYPISIYSQVIQGIVVFIFPYAFISYFPACYIFDKGNPLGMLGFASPLIVLYCFIISYKIFNSGLLKYESVGN